MTVTPFYPPDYLNPFPNGNLLIHSNDWSNGVWALSGVTQTPGFSPSPIIGANDATELINTSSHGPHAVNQAFTGISNLPYTLSCYVKANGSTTCNLGLNDGSNIITASFDLAAGLMTGTAIAGSAVINSTSIVPVGNSWFRISLTCQMAGTTDDASIGIGPPGIYTGSTANSIFVYGAQVTAAEVVGNNFVGMTVAPLVITSTIPWTPMYGGTASTPAVFPFLPGQAINVTKAPKFSTQVARSASGRERRLSYWSYPLWEYEVSYDFVRARPTNVELSIIWSFFMQMAGQAGTFLFADPEAYVTQCQFGVGDGATTTFRLARATTDTIEPIFNAYSSLGIFDNGALVPGLFAGTTGLVTFSSPPAAGHALSWYGYYYMGCRFLQDDLTFEQIVNQLWSGKSLKFTSVRVP